jgi:hypothetical protein
MEINGLMIDCSRLLELPQYYDRLLEFMAQWKMNTLILHFSDDHGCALNLPGFERFAMPRAWELAELQEFLVFAATLGIDVIPELETFGHTRYITDKPKYQHLSAGRRTEEVHFNAIDPLHEDTHSLMSRLIQTVASAFPSRYIHIGCDEVDIDEYCQQRNLVSDIVWADYVNRMIRIARSFGKIPMIWADHVVNSDLVASRLHKDVVLVEWRYDNNFTDDIIPRLQRFGFEDILVAPSLACYSDRFLPTRQRLENTDRMVAIAKVNRVNGLINTIWCPWRYLQNAMYYGIAYSSCAVQLGAHPDLIAFHEQFAYKTFGTDLLPSLASFLDNWTDLAMDVTLSAKITQPSQALTEIELHRVQKMVQIGEEVLITAQDYVPRKNQEIWHGMLLSAKCAWLCAESLYYRQIRKPPVVEKDNYDRQVLIVQKEMDLEWDRTRYPDDPQKYSAYFPNESDQYAMLIIRQLVDDTAKNQL